MFGKLEVSDWRRFRYVFTLFVVAILLLSGAVSSPAFGQSQPTPSSNIAELQDYAFAYGLYRDGLFQLAAEQFAKFTRSYPQSVKAQDAEFLHADCQFQLKQYPEAARELSEFISRNPSSILSDNARFRLGDAYVKLGRDLDAIEAYKSILDHPRDPSVAGEAAYWIGEIYFRESDYANALKYYTLSYEGYPGHRLQDYAAYSVAWTNQKKGDYAKAADWYRTVIEKMPKSSLVPSSRVKIGECYYALKEYGKTIEALTAARGSIDSLALRGEADYLIGESYYNLAQYENAQKQYEAFLKDYPNHRLTTDVEYALAWTFFKEKRFDEAAKTFNLLAGLRDPIGRAAEYHMGMAEKLAGKRDAALSTWNKAYERDPASEYADNDLYDAGLLLFEDKKTGEAKGYFRKVVEGFQSGDVIADASMMLGECYVATASFDSASTAYEKALSFPEASFETKVNSAYQFAWSLLKSKKYKESATAFSKFLAIYPDHPKAPDAAYWLAEAEYQGGDFRASLKEYQSIVAKAGHPRREEGMYGIGWTYYKMGNFSKAIDAFERLIVAYPSGKFPFDARLRLGDCYFQLKDYKKAAGAYRTVIRLFPKNEGADYALYQLGQTYYRSGDHDQASEQFSALIKGYPKSSLADASQYALGWMKFQKKDYLGAIGEFAVTIANYPASPLVPRAYYSTGDAYYNLRQYAAAEKSYREVLQKFPDNALASDALTGIQYSLVAQGKSKDAVGAIDTYVKENPTSPNTEQLELKKADLLFSQKQFGDAAREYRSFADRYRQSSLRPQALYWLGRSLQESGTPAEAAKVYLQAAEIPGASTNIQGNALLESVKIFVSLKDYEQAFTVLGRAEKSLANTEFSPQVAYLKGLVFFENGAMDNARASFEFVITRYPESVEAAKARIGLSKIAIHSGEYAQAQTLLQQVATSRTDEVGAEAQYLSGAAYADGGNLQDALTAFLRVRYVFPSQEVWLGKASLGLGHMYERLNDTVKAREAYQQVLKIFKSGAEFEDATGRLKVIGRE